MVFDDATWSPSFILCSIRRDLYLWAKSRNGTKLAVSVPRLIQMGLFPPIWSSRMRILHWNPPPMGRLKLNTDADVGRSLAGEGAVVRDSDGRFVHAFSYSLRLDFPLHVEA